MGSTETSRPLFRRVLQAGIRLPGRAVIGLIRLYQLILSPWLGPRCRFHPTCSNYCIEAVRQHGMVHGLWLGVKRIGKCHPLHPGGTDPVPGHEQNNLTRGTSDGAGRTTDRAPKNSRRVKPPASEERNYE